jgi:hypothetical protein
MHRANGAAALLFLASLVPWMFVNALFLQTPVLVSSYGAGILAWVSLAVQAGSVTSLTGWLATRRLLPSLRTQWVFCAVVCAVVGVTAACPFLFLARPYPLLLLVGLAGLLGALSTITVYPYAARFGDLFTVAASVGSGLSGAVPVALSLVQDPGGADRFSSRIYFFSLAAYATVGAAAAVVLVLLDARGALFGALRSDSGAAAEDGSGADSASEQGQAEELGVSRHRPCVNERCMLGRGGGSGSSESVGMETPGVLESPGALESPGGGVRAVAQTLAAPCAVQLVNAAMIYFSASMVPFSVRGFGRGGYALHMLLMSVAFVLATAAGRLATLWTRRWRLVMVPLLVAELPLFGFFVAACYLNELPRALFYALLAAYALFGALNGYVDTIVYVYVGQRAPAEWRSFASTAAAYAQQLGSVAGTSVALVLLLTDHQ